MEYHVKEVSSKEELDAICDVLIDYGDKSCQLFFPIFNNNRQATLDEAQDRLWTEHSNDPSSRWIYIYDTSIGLVTDGKPKLVGACQWKFYVTDPFSKGLPNPTATWWPEGGGRQFTTEFTRHLIEPRFKWMSRPHSGLSWMFVVPEYRCRGVGTALMRWGMQKTDELGLESYIEGTALGSILYRSCGYRVITRININMEYEGAGDPDKVWKHLESLMLPCGIDVTWRPVRGIWTEGEPGKTWRSRLQLNHDE